MTQTPPTPPEEEQIVLIRGSEEYKEYMRHQGGRLKVFVNRLESDIATAGRIMLLLFLIYATVKTGLDRMGVSVPIWVEIVMLSLQVAGVEGAVPGLSRQKADLTAQGKAEEAGEIASAITSTRWLALLTGVEIGLSTVQAKIPNVDWLSWTLVGYSVVLLLARLWLITKFLIAMAKIEQRGPKIISQAEYDRQQHEAEQEQIRLDNAAIQAVISKALSVWEEKQEQQQRVVHRNTQTQIDEVLGRWMTQQNQVIAKQLEEVTQASSSRQVPVQEDTQVIIQAVIAELVPQLQAKFQVLDQAIFRQNVTIREIENQAKSLPERRQRSGKSLPENAASVQTRQTEQNVIRLVPANASRDELKAEAIRLHTVEGMSSYKIAERLGKSAKTVQSWLSSSKDQAECEDVETVN